MTDLSHVDDLLSAYMDGELDAAMRARVEAHLQACARCGQELETWRGLHAQLRDAAVPDPGAAYWSRFATRVHERLPGAASSRTPWVERLAGWFAPSERIAWGRVAGAFAIVTLVTYVGMRGFEPDRVQGIKPPAESGHSMTTQPTVPSPAPAATPPPGPEPSVTEDVDLARPAPIPSRRSPALPKQSAAAPDADAPEERAGVASAERAAADARSATQPVASHVTNSALAERSVADEVAKTERPAAGAMPPAPGTATQRAQVPSTPGAEDDVRTFVAAALVGDTLAARAMRDAMAARDPAAAQLKPMDAWLQLPVPSAAGVRRATTAELAALDALLWPRREQPALRPHVEELARRLTQHAEDAALRARAVAYVEWLAETAPDAAGRAAWRATLESLRP